MRRTRKSAAEEPVQKGGRLLLHLGPGVRQAIEGDEVYFVEVNVVLPVSGSALGAQWGAFGED